MPRWTLRILAPLALLAPLAGSAEAGAGDHSGAALSSFGGLAPVQTVQFGGSNCYYADGWNGRGWYQCGNEWNDGFGWVGPFNLNTFGGSAIRRHHHGVAVSHPQALNPVYPRLEPPRWLGAAGGGFHGGLGGNFDHGAGVPHIGAPISPRFAGGGFHKLGGATGVHIGARASPSFAGVGTFHAGGGFHGLGGATGVHIGAPASPSFAGVGTFHAGAGIGAPHIGAFASPGFAGGGFHGVGGGGVFQGGGAALGQGGIGHR
jgi:hypothetical protein